MVLDRRQALLSGIHKTQQGIEIAPWMHPIAPKRDGYRILSLDVFPTETLHRTAAEDPNIPHEAISNIEDVDIVGSADDLAEHIDARNMLGEIDYIISSHNFEHLPNPVRFLQGCERVLRDGGVVAMAVPDYRTCFDYFRPFSTTADFVSAYLADQKAPTPGQFFTQNSLHSRYFHADGQIEGSFELGVDVRHVLPLESLRGAYDTWQAHIASSGQASYRDTHCWAFSPSSFALIVGDLAHLGLTMLRLEDISSTNGNEFYVRLRKIDAFNTDEKAFYARRAELMHATKDEAAENTRLVQSLRRELARLTGQA